MDRGLHSYDKIKGANNNRIGTFELRESALGSGDIHQCKQHHIWYNGLLNRTACRRSAERVPLGISEHRSGFRPGASRLLWWHLASVFRVPRAQPLGRYS